MEKVTRNFKLESGPVRVRKINIQDLPIQLCATWNTVHNSILTRKSRPRVDCSKGG